MAQKIVKIITDDITGEESSDARTNTFSINGSEYEIDLTPESEDKLMEALAPFIQNGRRVKKSRTASAGSKPRTDPRANDRTHEIREWARANGYDIAPRGRIPATIQQAFKEAEGK